MFRFKKPFILTVFLIGMNASFVHGAEAPLRIVTSTTVFADLAKQIGGEKVDVKSVASPKFNTHFIQPKPSDVRNVRKADLFVFAGLDLEAWADPLLEAAGRPELFRGASRNVDMSERIRLLKVPAGILSRAEGDLHLFGNPHYVMNPENFRIMANTLLRKLKEIDAANAIFYEKNAEGFLSRLEREIQKWKSACARCAEKEVIPYHDDFEYFAQFIGVKAEQFLEPKPGVPPSPRHLQFLEDYAKKNNVLGVVLPTYYPKDVAESFAKRAGISALPVYQSVGEAEGTENIFSFFETNVKNMAVLCGGEG